MSSKSIYLCGFMGCGKSTVGALLAKKLGMSFTDLDEYIVKKDGRAIPQIFAEDGEEYFRSLETAAVKEFSEKNAVIACGGGTMLRRENGIAAAEKGVVVYLDSDFEVCYDRIKDDKGRPIAASRTKEQLCDLFCERKPKYIENSSIVVPAYGTPEEVAERIIAAI